LHFVQSGLVQPEWGRFLTRVEKLREGADYDFFIQYDKNELAEYFPQAKEFIEQIKVLFNK